MKSTIGRLRRPRNAAPPVMAGGTPRVSSLGYGSTATQLQAYGSVSTLFAIVNRISVATSQVPWSLYRSTTDGRRVYEGQETRTQVTSHALLDLWAKPNPWTTGQEFREATQQHLDLTGEAWWVIGRNPLSNLPLELWTVRPDRMAPVPHPEKYISGYIYKGPGGEKVPLGLDDVVHIKMPNPYDPYRGLGPVQSLLVDLDAATYSAAWNRNFFLNDATPGGIIEFPEKLGDQDWKEFVERWREQHRGVDNAHRVAVLERGQWKDRSMSMRDMQFVELRKVAREVIREAFALHGHMLGLSEDVNKANAEAGAASFGKWTVRPRLGRIKGAVNARLLPLYGPSGLELDHGDPEPPDREADDRERESKSRAFAAYIAAGVDPEDAAIVVGLPPMDMVEKEDPPPVQEPPPPPEAPAPEESEKEPAEEAAA